MKKKLIASFIATTLFSCSADELTISGWTSLRGAEVATYLGGERWSTEADLDGRYELVVELTDASDELVAIRALGTAARGQAGVELISILDQVDRVVEQAGDDDRLEPSESPATAISSVSTARYAALYAANEGPLTSRAEVIQAELGVLELMAQWEILSFAGFFERVATGRDVDLGAGFETTLDLAENLEALRRVHARYSGSWIGPGPTNDSMRSAFAQREAYVVVDGRPSWDFMFNPVSNRRGYVGEFGRRYRLGDGGFGEREYAWDGPLPQPRAVRWSASGVDLEIRDPISYVESLSGARLAALVPDEGLANSILAVIGRSGWIDVPTEVVENRWRIIPGGLALDFVVGERTTRLRLDEALAPYGLQGPNLETTWPVGAVWRHGEGTSGERFEAAEIAGRWLMAVVLPPDDDSEGAAVLADAVVSFREDGRILLQQEAIATWELGANGRLLVSYDEGHRDRMTPVVRTSGDIGVIHQFEIDGRTTVAYRAARKLPDALPALPSLVLPVDEFWQDAVALAASPGRPDDPLSMEDEHGLAFESDGRAFSVISGEVLGRFPWRYSVDATGVVTLQMRVDQYGEGDCDDEDPSCITVYRWTHRIVDIHEGQLRVVEEFARHPLEVELLRGELEWNGHTYVDTAGREVTRQLRRSMWPQLNALVRRRFGS